MTTGTNHHTINLDAPLIARALEQWFRSNQRVFPWRINYKDRQLMAYRCLVSELMLQQTQVSRVIDRFNRFIECFPTIKNLAQADEQEVLAQWQGLGYYRRARHLHAAAIKITHTLSGMIPEDSKALQTLPGIGRYTAGAIASIAFGEHAPIVDGNVSRVISRLLAIKLPVNDTKAVKQHWTIADELVTNCKVPGDLNQSLMELGSTVCTPRNPTCDNCPIHQYCAAHKYKVTGQIPLPKKTIERTIVFASTSIVLRRGRILLEQRPSKGIWASMWQLPTIEAQDAQPTPDDLSAFLSETFGLIVEDSAPVIERMRFIRKLTHREVRFVVYDFSKVRGRLHRKNGRWIDRSDLDMYPLSNAQHYIIKQIGFAS